MENGGYKMKVCLRVPRTFRHSLPRMLVTNVQCHPLLPFPSHQLKSQVNPSGLYNQRRQSRFKPWPDSLKGEDWGKGGLCSVAERTHPHDGAGKASHENVLFCLWKINSACNFIILPFLETLTPIDAVNVWEATKCPFLKTSYYL